MSDKKISELIAATSTVDADLATIVQGGINKKITSSLIGDYIGTTKIYNGLSTFKKTFKDSINELYSFPNKIFSDVSYFCNSTPTKTLTTTGSGDLATIVGTLVDGDILEIQVSASYDSITLPTGIRCAIRVKKGYDVELNAAQGITIPNGASNVFVAGFIFDSNPGGSNNKGSAICFEHQAIANDITFYNCTFRNNSHSAVLLSYHQSIGGDNYATANTLAELSNRISFVECHFDRSANEAIEGASIVLRGINIPFIYECDINARSLSRGINIQNSRNCHISYNNVINAGGGGNGEGIKLDKIGSPTYYNSGIFYKNRVANCTEGIDIDDTDEAIVLQNTVSGCSTEGISLDPTSIGVFIQNITFNNVDGIRFEAASVGNLKGNVSFNNSSNNFRMDNAYVPDNSNTTAISDTFIGADKIPYDNSSSGLSATLVQDAIDEIYSEENLWDRSTTRLVPHNVGDTVAATTSTGDILSVTEIGSTSNSLGYLRHVGHVGGVSTLDIDAIDDTGTGSSTINFGYNTTSGGQNYVFYRGAAQYDAHPLFVVETQIPDIKYVDDLSRRIYEAQMDPTGFVDRVATLSFVDGTRTFTITGSHAIYISGIKTTKTTDSIVIANTVSVHWIYYDGTGTLSESTTPPDFYLPLIATVYWDGTKGVLGEERHGINMYGSVHEYLHKTVGARYINGLAGTFTDTTISIDSGSFADEDITHEFLAPLTTCNVFYKNGTADFTWDGPQAAPYKTVTGTIQYNNVNALANVNISSYVAYWVFITNDINTPLMVLMGQRQDNTIANARTNNTYQSLVFGQLPYAEAKLIYRIIFQNVAGNPTYVEAQDYRTVSNLPSGTYVATSHNILSDLQQAGTGITWGHISDGSQDIYGAKTFYNNILQKSLLGTVTLGHDAVNTQYGKLLVDATGSPTTYFDLDIVADSTAYFYVGRNMSQPLRDASFMYNYLLQRNIRFGGAGSDANVLETWNEATGADLTGTSSSIALYQRQGSIRPFGKISWTAEDTFQAALATQDVGFRAYVLNAGSLVSGIYIDKDQKGYFYNDVSSESGFYSKASFTEKVYNGVTLDNTIIFGADPSNHAISRLYITNATAGYSYLDINMFTNSSTLYIGRLTNQRETGSYPNQYLYNYHLQRNIRFAAAGANANVLETWNENDLTAGTDLTGTSSSVAFYQRIADSSMWQLGALQFYCSGAWTTTASTRNSNATIQVSQNGSMVTGLLIDSTKAVTTYGLTTVNHNAAVNDPSLLVVNTARRAIITCKGDSSLDTGTDKVCGGIRFEDIQATGGNAFVLWQPGVSGQPLGLWNNGRQFYVTNVGDAYFYNNINTGGDVMVNDAADAYYLGPQTVDGSWRWIKDGNNTVMQRRESATWVTKTTFSA